MVEGIGQDIEEGNTVVVVVVVAGIGGRLYIRNNKSVGIENE